MSIKTFHADPKSYAPFVALRYNTTKATQLFGLVNLALAYRYNANIHNYINLIKRN